VNLQARISKVEPDIVVVYLSGDIILGEAEELDSLVRDLLVQGEKKLIFELSGVVRIDSVGGMTVVRCLFVVRDAGGELRFAGAGENVVGLFKNTQFATALPFDSTLAAACEHFAGGAKT
jgi:anti-anti-sigma factor